jgi:hypothetical protein
LFQCIKFLVQLIEISATNLQPALGADAKTGATGKSAGGRCVRNLAIIYRKNKNGQNQNFCPF